MKGSQLFINGEPRGNYLDIDNNHLYVKTSKSRDETLLKVPYELRHKGLYLTYIDGETNAIVTKKYIATSVDDSNWTNLDNWADINDGDGTGSGSDSGSGNLVPISLQASAKEGEIAAANVTALDEPNNFAIAFTIPRGATGPQGPAGPQGIQGPAGKDGVDGAPGKDGVALPGITYEHRYALGSKTTAPSINKTDRNPGYNWIETYPTILDKASQAIWITTAKVNPDGTLNTNWSTPVIYISYGTDGSNGPQGPQGPQGPAGADGADGKDGSTPIIGDNGNWWINGVDTGVQASGGESTGVPPEIPNYYSYVYYRGASKPASLNDSGISYITIDDILRNTAWEDFPTGDGPWWQTTILVNGSTKAIIKISDPLPFNQEGAAGSDGVWTKMMFMWYFVGTGYTKINWDNWYNTNKGNANPNTSQTSFTENPGKCPGELKDYEYIMIAAQFKTVDGVQTMQSNWSYPTNIKGENGVQGPAGERGPVLYPAGVFELNKTYTRTSNEAPYVYYNGKWYWLKTLGNFISTTTSNNPSTSADWAEFTGYEAIFAKIGIIGNGLIGNAVFNGIWMFSKRGLDANGDESYDYQKFYNGQELSDNTNYNPYEEGSPFKPALAINLKTGDIYFNYGNGVLNEEGFQYYANINEGTEHPPLYNKCVFSEEGIMMTQTADGTSHFNYEMNLTKNGLTCVHRNNESIIDINYDNIILKNKQNRIKLDFNGLAMYSKPENVEVVTDDGYNDVYISDFTHRIHSSLPGVYTLLNGNIIRLDGLNIILPPLRPTEHIEIKYLSYNESRTIKDSLRFKGMTGSTIEFNIVNINAATEDQIATLENGVVTVDGYTSFTIYGEGYTGGLTKYCFFYNGKYK